jgi:cytochrome bd-type quinol oxidase subunit 2
MFNLAGYAALLDYHYWSNTRPVPLGPSLVGGFVFFLGWFLLAGLALIIAAYVVKKSGDKLKAKVLSKFARAMLNTGLLGYLFLFFAYEQLPVLGMRLWAVLWLAVFCLWIASAVKFATKEYPARRSRQERLQALHKYLPGKKLS